MSAVVMVTIHMKCCPLLSWQLILSFVVVATNCNNLFKTMYVETSLFYLNNCI